MEPREPDPGGVSDPPLAVEPDPDGTEGSERADHDSPWKEATQEFFREFLLLTDPEFAARVDWSFTPKFRSQELRQFGAHAPRGPDHVDHLIELRLLDAPEVPRFAHLEIQAQTQYGTVFTRRMLRYKELISVHYDTLPIGMAVLIDETRTWRPHEHVEESEGCRTTWQYRVIKIEDWAARREELEASDNPFAVIVLAHLDARATTRDPAARYTAKWRRIESLYHNAWGERTAQKLFRLVNWMLPLPEGAEQRFWQALKEFEEAQGMPYVLPMERWAREEGRREGRREGRQEGRQEGRVLTTREFVARILARRFAVDADEWLGRLAGIEDLERLEQLETAAWTTPSLQEFQRAGPWNGAGGDSQAPPLPSS